MRKIALLISLISLISAYAINTLNIKKLSESGIELRGGETVITADDASYLVPAFNYLNTGELKNDMAGNGAYFLRPPGYSLIYVCLGAFFDIPTSLKCIKVLQLLMFALSVYCLFFIAYAVLESIPWALVTTSLYGVTNIASGFLFYTLTEGVTPALVIFFVFILIKARAAEVKVSKVSLYYFGALIFTFIFVTRPFLAIIGLAIPYFLFVDFRKDKKVLFIHLFIMGAIALSAMFFWQIRNYKLTNEYVGLHPIYYPENSSSCFRPAHQTLWDLYKSWGELGVNFHASIEPFWTSAISGNKSDADIDNIISKMPAEVVNSLTRPKLERMFAAYQESILHQKKYYDKGLAMPKEVPAIELKTIQYIDELIVEYRKRHWFQYCIVTPVKVFREMVFHSNLSHYIFQHTYRGNWLVETLRISCFAIHSLAFCSLFLALFVKLKSHFKAVFLYVPLIYVAYLIFIQRGIEERYTLPILSLVLIHGAYVFKTIIFYLGQQLRMLR